MLSIVEYMSIIILSTHTHLFTQSHPPLHTHASTISVGVYSAYKSPEIIIICVYGVHYTNIIHVYRQCVHEASLFFYLLASTCHAKSVFRSSNM